VLPGVHEVVQITEPYKLVSRTFKQEGNQCPGFEEESGAFLWQERSGGCFQSFYAFLDVFEIFLRFRLDVLDVLQAFFEREDALVVGVRLGFHIFEAVPQKVQPDLQLDEAGFHGLLHLLEVLLEFLKLLLDIQELSSGHASQRFLRFGGDLSDHLPDVFEILLI